MNKPFSPTTLEDMKAALDCVVQKQGVFNLVFHPHGWIKPEQVVELIDHAVAKHGRKVKFLNFREAHERLNKNPRLAEDDFAAAARPSAPRRRRFLRVLDSLMNKAAMRACDLSTSTRTGTSTWSGRTIRTSVSISMIAARKAGLAR